MNKLIIIILISFLNFSCVKNNVELPQSSKIITKYRVLDEIISPNNRNCSEESVPYRQMNKYAGFKSEVQHF